MNCAYNYNLYIKGNCSLRYIFRITWVPFHIVCYVFFPQTHNNFYIWIKSQITGIIFLNFRNQYFFFKFYEKFLIENYMVRLLIFFSHLIFFYKIWRRQNGKKQSSLKVQRSLLKMYVSCITKIDDYPLSINNTLWVRFYMKCMYYVVSIFTLNMDIFC